MNNNLSFDFTADKVAQKVYISREFDAELSLVWDAYTQPELLDQWWAPEPFKSRTKRMEYKVGGQRVFAMVSPEGQEGWLIQTYTSISPKTNFKFLNTFADANENPQLPGSEWDITFSEKNGITTVNITIYNESLERMERMLEMGFKQGFTASMENLAKVLKSQS